MVGYRWTEPMKEVEPTNDDRSALIVENLEMSLMLNGFFAGAAGTELAWIQQNLFPYKLNNFN